MVVASAYSENPEGGPGPLTITLKRCCNTGDDEGSCRVNGAGLVVPPSTTATPVGYGPAFIAVSGALAHGGKKKKKGDEPGKLLRDPPTKFPFVMSSTDCTLGV